MRESKNHDREFWEHKTSRSRRLFELASKSMLGGVASVLHKSAEEPFPLYVERASGSKIYDVDGNEYIDYTGSFGPAILGYCPEPISQAVIEQISLGSHFGAPTESLYDLGEKLVSIIPCADMVNLQSSGTEAVMAALRYARGFTGKDKFIRFEGHYHGWSDELFVSTKVEKIDDLGPKVHPAHAMVSKGQANYASESSIILPWNDLDLLERTISKERNSIAAVLTEPVMFNCDPVFPQENYLQGLRELTASNDIVLIFDEIITGFRLSLGGAQQYFGVIPDLSTFGKAAAGGFQISGVAGRRDIMSTGVNPMGTFNGNPIAVAACLSTINVLENEQVYEKMRESTAKLVVGIEEIARRKGIPVLCRSMESIGQIAFGLTEALKDYRDTFKVDKSKYNLFRIGCLARGVRFHSHVGRVYVSAAHSTEDIDKTIEVVQEVL